MSSPQATWINGVESDLISVSDRAFQFGHGLFETLLVHDGQLVLGAYHIDRLRAGAQTLSINFDPVFVQKCLQSALDRTANATAVIKLVLTAGKSTRGYQLPREGEASIVVQLFPPPVLSPNMWESGQRVRVCDYRLPANPALAGLKHLNRLDQIIARAEWSDPDIDDGLVCDQEGNLVEAISSNLFVYRSGAYRTPSLERAGIAGTMRRYLIENGDQLGIDVGVQDRVTLDDLRSADGLFLTNSVRGIMPIGEVVGVSRFPILQEFRDLAESVNNALGYDFGCSKTSH